MDSLYLLLVTSNILKLNNHFRYNNFCQLFAVFYVPLRQKENIEGEFKMKVSTSINCGEFQRNFVFGEIVYFAWIENRSFCSDCSPKLNFKDWEESRIIEVE